jgi:hypothetical protein
MAIYYIYIPMILPCSDNPHESPESVDHLSAKAFCGCEAKPGYLRTAVSKRARL